MVAFAEAKMSFATTHLEGGGGVFYLVQDVAKSLFRVLFA